MRTRDRLLAAALIALLALAVRWGWLQQPWGVRLVPRPDALEYAAGAQALAQSGDYLLQVGPYRVRPRYSPGWPMLLAAAAKAGVPAESLWRMAGPVDALLAALLALVAGEVAARLAVASGRQPLASRPRVAFGVAAGVTGVAWALGPGPICLGGSLLSDTPATLMALLALTAGGACLLGGTRSPGLAGAAGLAAGATLAMRPVTGALLVVPLALWGGLALLRRERGVVAVLAAMAAGAAIPAGLVAVVLARSGLEPWRWSDYQLWLPVLFGSGGDVFHWRYAVTPDTTYLRPYSHAGVGLRVLLGVRGLPYHQYAGLFWPPAGWVALLALATVVPRDLGSPARVVRPAVLGMALWTLAHFLLFSCYFYPAGRFYLGPLAVCATALGAASGLAAAAGGRNWLAAMLGVALVAASAAWTLPLIRRYAPQGEPAHESQVAAKVARWRALDDRQRSERVL